MVLLSLSKKFPEHYPKIGYGCFHIISNLSSITTLLFPISHHMTCSVHKTALNKTGRNERKMFKQIMKNINM